MGDHIPLISMSELKKALMISYLFKEFSIHTIAFFELLLGSHFTYYTEFFEGPPSFSAGNSAAAVTAFIGSLAIRYQMAYLQHNNLGDACIENFAGFTKYCKRPLRKLFSGQN